MKRVTQAIGDDEEMRYPTKKVISSARRDETENGETSAEAFH